MEITGTCYYVSADGNDANDGLSPDTSWQTIAKVNATEFAPGDGIRFRRGDVWRGEMIWHYFPNVTYAAYGEGAKPAFYGSPENGTGADRWTLLDGTDNLWVYDTPMPYCGSLILNDGEVVAAPYIAYWNGTMYTQYGTADVPLDLLQMPDLSFFVDVDLTGWSKDPEHRGSNGDLHVYDCMETGTLTLRCDAGNPGALFENIEFGIGWGLQVGSGCVVDNLCVKFVGNCGVMSDPGGAKGIAVQNCEIAFMGDVYLTFEAESCHGILGGEGVGFNGYGSKCLNNYIHDGREGAFTIELGWDGTVQDGQHKLGGMLAEGNLFVRNNGGIGLINFLEGTVPIEMSGITIADNLFVKTGYQNTLTEWCDAEDVVACIHVWFAGQCYTLTDVSIRDNTFYLATPKLINLLNFGNAQLDFEGNTYVQGMYQRAMTYAPTYDTRQEIAAVDEATFTEAVREKLGDESARVCTITLGLTDAEVDRAQALGLVPADAPEDLDTQLTSAEMTALLTGVIGSRDESLLPAWTELASTAEASDRQLLRSDGMLALYEAARVLGLDVPDQSYGWSDSWAHFRQIKDALGDGWVEMDNADLELYPNARETGLDPDSPDLCLYHLSMLYALGQYSTATNQYLLGFDEARGTLDGNEPLTWRMALQAVVRMLDRENPNADKYYLVTQP